MRVVRWMLVFVLIATAATVAQRGQGAGPAPAPLNLPADTPKVTALKTEAADEVGKMDTLIQQGVDRKSTR